MSASQLLLNNIYEFVDSASDNALGNDPPNDIADDILEILQENSMIAAGLTKEQIQISKQQNQAQEPYSPPEER